MPQGQEIGPIKKVTAMVSYSPELPRRGQMAFNNVGMAVRFSYAMKVDDQDAKYSQDR